jgi:hypothetical protein
VDASLEPVVANIAFSDLECRLRKLSLATTSAFGKAFAPRMAGHAEVKHAANLGGIGDERHEPTARQKLADEGSWDNDPLVDIEAMPLEVSGVGEIRGRVSRLNTRQK